MFGTLVRILIVSGCETYVTRTIPSRQGSRWPCDLSQDPASR